MCGIFGFAISKQTTLKSSEISHLLNDLFLLSESRGKEAAGLSIVNENSIDVKKSPIPASQFIRTDDYQGFIKNSYSDQQNDSNSKSSKSFIGVGHSRLVTNGGQQINSNNQPVIAKNMVAIHNGIITNVDDLWESHPTFTKNTQLDTEVFLSLMDESRRKGKSIKTSLHEVYQQIEGVASLAILFSEIDCLLLSTNNGSVFFIESQNPGIFVFASEKYILEKLVVKHNWLKVLNPINQLKPGNAILIKYDTTAIDHFEFVKNSDATDPEWISTGKSDLKINDLSKNTFQDIQKIRTPGEGPYSLPKSFVDEFPRAEKAVANLRRCTRCILPETMPFIDFDENGVCNYCRYEETLQPQGLEELEKKIAPYRKNNGDPECVVTFSGGRDSSYGVHFVSEILKMKPITYTYDWGMVTDLGRRNQMRMCGKLGLEHILVSADLARKRKNIRMNIGAWLNNPDLGTIPLFMAGDKQYFYYANMVGRQTNCDLIILCENMLETTRFKSGYCGIAPNFGSSHTYSLDLGNKFRLLKYYGNNFIKNPKYLNSSLLDTFGAYLAYYFLPHNYLNLYQYIQWDEGIINKTLIETYNWETARDSKSTWRIGDGTASFYNYIYYMMSGFTENDTFRSNQIRAGIMNREEALTFVRDENTPRYNSIQWYCDIIGIDFQSTIETINKAPRLYDLG